MNCPECDSRSTFVLETRPDINGEIRRRRECQDCKCRFTTYEVHSSNMLDDNEIQKNKEELVNSLVTAEKLLELIKKQVLLIP
tara:strand:+ start:252 stop:500 length:249 start_codon:yes stop_codon:yes gene_type:complete